MSGSSATSPTAARNSIPSGTVTLFFTDIESSTVLWEKYPHQMRIALSKHDALLRAEIERFDGYVVKFLGDGVLAGFPVASQAVRAALFIQRRCLRELLQPVAEPETAQTSPFPGLKVRMAVHTGSPELREGDYFGPSVNRAARLLSLAHGGQIILSGITEALIWR